MLCSFERQQTLKATSSFTALRWVPSGHQADVSSRSSSLEDIGTSSSWSFSFPSTSEVASRVSSVEAGLAASSFSFPTPPCCCVSCPCCSRRSGCNPSVPAGFSATTVSPIACSTKENHLHSYCCDFALAPPLGDRQCSLFRDFRGYRALFPRQF